MDVLFTMFPILLLLLVWIPLLALFIYMSVLFIKLARRGIMALDIYLAEKRGVTR